MTESLVSVPELLKKILDDDTQVRESVPGGVVVGPATETQQKKGAIILAESGVSRLERYVALLRMQMTARCIAESVDRTERISAVLYDVLHAQGRRVVEQASTEQSFLVHNTYITGGPLLAVGEIEGTWENVVTVEVLVGTDPIP